MTRRICVLHAWKGFGRCPWCAQAKPMDSSVHPSERAYTMTLALIDGGVFTPEQAQQLRDRFERYAGGAA